MQWVSRRSVASNSVPYTRIIELRRQGFPDAFSAVKALQKASEQGERIYQIDGMNQSQVLPQLNLDPETENDIAQALNVGLEVIAHENPVSVPGYSGAGYIIFDPQTGDGAYRISGGANSGAQNDSATDLIGSVFLSILLKKVPMRLSS